MGSSAAYHLAKGGLRVLGLDRFHPPHNFGSSHGLTRIIREAYFEDPLYVPLVQRAYELWADLEKQSGHQLLLKTGGLMIGAPDGALVAGASRSAEQHQLEHEILNSTNLAQKFPVFNVDDDPMAVWEPRAGILFPERAIQTHLDLAAKLGAHLRFNEPVCKWEPLGTAPRSTNSPSNLERAQCDPPLPIRWGEGRGEGPRHAGVRVFTDANSYTANHLVLSPGAWMNDLLSARKLPLSVDRQVLFWFKPVSHPEMFQPDHFPIFIRQYAHDRFFYGFPDLGDGIKVAFHHQGGQVDPNSLSQEVALNEIEEMRRVLSKYLPATNGELQSTAVCMYTNTPDEHFVLDYHPEFPQVIVASPCSGHGFKFSPVIGEMIAAMIEGKQPRFNLGLFKIARFSK
jgi:sarcosine oxidase